MDAGQSVVYMPRGFWAKGPHIWEFLPEIIIYVDPDQLFITRPIDGYFLINVLERNFAHIDKKNIAVKLVKTA